MFDQKYNQQMLSKSNVLYTIKKFSKCIYLKWSCIMIWDSKQKNMMRRKVKGQILPFLLGESDNAIQNPFFLFIKTK